MFIILMVLIIFYHNLILLHLLDIAITMILQESLLLTNRVPSLCLTLSSNLYNLLIFSLLPHLYLDLMVFYSNLLYLFLLMLFRLLVIHLASVMAHSLKSNLHIPPRLNLHYLCKPLLHTYYPSDFSVF